MLAREFPEFDSDVAIALGTVGTTFTVLDDTGAQHTGCVGGVYFSHFLSYE